MLAYSASSSSSSSSSSSFVSFVVVLSSAQCQPATAIIGAQCSLPDLNRDHLCSVFQAGPQPRPSVLSVPSRTSTATICTQCSLPDLDRDRNNFSHDRILSSLKRCLSGIALMFGPRAGLARPRGGLAGARYYPVHLARLLHVSLPWQDFYAMYLDTYTSTIFTGC